MSAPISPLFACCSPYVEVYHAPRTSQTRRAHLRLGGACPRRPPRRARPLSRRAGDPHRPQSQSQCDHPACLAPVSRDPTPGGPTDATPALGRALRTWYHGSRALGVSAEVSRPAVPSRRALVVRRRWWRAPGLILAPGLPQGCNNLRRQGHPPRPARGDLQAVEFARLAPIRNRVHRHVEQIGSRPCTIALVASLAVGHGHRPQRTATLDAIRIADPLYLTPRKYPTLPTAIARVIETLGDLEIGMVRSPLPHALDDLRVRPADHPCPLGARHFERTTGVGLPTHIQPNRPFELGEGYILNQEAHHLFAFRLGGAVGLPHQGQIVG